VGTRVSRVTAGTRVGLRMERRGFDNGFGVVCGGNISHVDILSRFGMGLGLSRFGLLSHKKVVEVAFLNCLGLAFRYLYVKPLILLLLITACRTDVT
jgi:hypothetical protein